MTDNSPQSSSGEKRLEAGKTVQKCDEFKFREIQVINGVPEDAIYHPGLSINLGTVIRDGASSKYKALYRMACRIYNEKSLLCSIYPTNELEIEYSMIKQGIYKIDGVLLSLPENVDYETVQVYHFDGHVEIHGNYKTGESCSTSTDPK